VFSPEGGIVVILGYGFSLEKSNNTVLVGSYPCNIIQSDSFTIKCEVKFTNKAANLLPIRTKGNGIEKWLYDARNSPLFEITTGRFREFFFANASKIGLPLISYSIESEFDRFLTSDKLKTIL
jgi:IPT/TIG domain